MSDSLEMIQLVRRILSERIDLTKKLSDNDVRKTIMEIITEQSKTQYMSIGVSEKK